MHRESGFSLTELMIVTAIVAILASVAIPAYVNYRNRAVQAEAIEALLRAKMDQEVFWAENNRYANTVGCLPSFGNTCGQGNNYSTPNLYRIAIASASGTNFRIRAAKTIRSTVAADTLAITATLQNPVINNVAALKFSVFKWLFQ